jgi:hypothetical protein
LPPLPRALSYSMSLAGPVNEIKNNQSDQIERNPIDKSRKSKRFIRKTIPNGNIDIDKKTIDEAMASVANLVTAPVNTNIKVNQSNNNNKIQTSLLTKTVSVPSIMDKYKIFDLDSNNICDISRETNFSDDFESKTCQHQHRGYDTKSCDFKVNHNDNEDCISLRNNNSFKTPRDTTTTG